MPPSVLSSRIISALCQMHWVFVCNQGWFSITLIMRLLTGSLKKNPLPIAKSALSKLLLQVLHPFLWSLLNHLVNWRSRCVRGGRCAWACFGLHAIPFFHHPMTRLGLWRITTNYVNNRGVVALVSEKTPKKSQLSSSPLNGFQLSWTAFGSPFSVFKE